MIRLNSWQEAVEKPEKLQRLSDILPSYDGASQVQHLPSTSSSRRVSVPATDLAALYEKRLKRQTVEEMQFWQDFHAYQREGQVAGRCFFVKVVGRAVEMVGDGLVRVGVVDEYEGERVLYLSLGWMRGQGKLDRPVQAALQNRRLPDTLSAGDIICLYDEIIIGDTIFADKFHF